MAICVNCNKNSAVIFTSRFVGNERHDEGYCLTCAYKMNLPGLSSMFGQAGVNEENIDNFIAKMYEVKKYIEKIFKQ